MEAAGGIEPPYGALQVIVSCVHFPTSEARRQKRCTLFAHEPALAPVWPVERLRALRWGVGAQRVIASTQTKGGTHGSRY